MLFDAFEHTIQNIGIFHEDSQHRVTVFHSRHRNTQETFLEDPYVLGQNFISCNIRPKLLLDTPRIRDCCRAERRGILLKIIPLHYQGFIQYAQFLKQHEDCPSHCQFFKPHVYNPQPCYVKEHKLKPQTTLFWVTDFFWQWYWRAAVRRAVVYRSTFTEHGMTSSPTRCADAIPFPSSQLVRKIAFRNTSEVSVPPCVYSGSYGD
jgi:hypothetical protein